MNQNISNYTFSASTKEITLIGITVNVEKVRLIKNLTTNTFIYKFTDALSISSIGSVITFTADNTGMTNTDKLLIQYDLQTSIDKQLVSITDSIIDMPMVNTPSLPVRTSPQKYIDCSFSGVGSGLITSDFTQIAAGAGMTVSQSAGNLVVLSGTTTNAEFVARSVQYANLALTLKSIITLSQRIVNNNFFIELVDVIGDALAYNIINTTTVNVTKTAHGFTSQNVGQRMDLCALSSVGVPMEGVIASIPDANTIQFTVAGFPASGSGTLSLTGYNKIELLYNGTTATSATFNTRRKGWQNTAATATINTTVSGHLVSINTENGIASLGDKTLAAANALIDRTSWDTNIPQPEVNLYVQIRVKNGTTAPATTTTCTIGMVRIEDYIPSQVSVVSTRQQSLNNSLPVKVLSAPTTAVSGSLTSAGTTTNTPVTPTASIVNSAATTNGTVVKASAGTLYSIVVSSTRGTTCYLKFHNSATVTAGTTAVALTIAVPTNSTITVPFGATGMRFGTGICLSITGAAADSDTTAIGVNEVKVLTAYI